MNRLVRISKWCTAAGVAALLLNGGVARAATPWLDLCEAGIESATNKYNAAVSKALNLCADAVRKQQVKEAAKAGTGPLATAAKLCEIKLAGVYDLANAKPGKSTV